MHKKKCIFIHSNLFLYFSFLSFILNILFNPLPITWKKVRDFNNLSDSIYLFTALKVALLSLVEKLYVPFSFVTIAKRDIHFPRKLTDPNT